MNETLKAVVRLLEDGTRELQVAAAQILGELAPKEDAVVEALDHRLSPAENTLNRYVMQALAKIGTPKAIKVLVGRMRDGGAAADLVKHLLSSIGGSVADSLSETFDEEEPELRRQILQILGHYAELSSMRILQSAMLGDDDTLSKEAREFLAARLEEIPEEDRKEFRDGIYQVVKTNKELTPVALAGGLAIMAQVNVAQSRATLLKYAQDGHPPIVREAALRGLEHASLTGGQSDTLLGYLEDADTTHVVKPALVALSGHSDWSKTGITKLRGLLTSRREEMKLFALRSLKGVQSEEVAKVYLAQLNSPKAGLREVAIDALGQNAKAVPVLLKSMQNERNAQKARALVQPLMAHASKIKGPQLKSMAEKCAKLLADGNELGDVHLELLLAVNQQSTAEQLVDKAMRLRRARKFTETLRILMRLAQAEVLDLEGRYQLALARLIKDSDEGRSGVISYTGDATMGFIAGLVRDEFPVFERLKKESMLQPEDLLRVGRHFNASIGPEQRFGTDMLVYVAKKHAKAKAGEEARMMIRTEGLG